MNPFQAQAALMQQQMLMMQQQCALMQQPVMGQAMQSGSVQPCPAPGTEMPSPTAAALPPVAPGAVVASPMSALQGMPSTISALGAGMPAAATMSPVVSSPSSAAAVSSPTLPAPVSAPAEGAMVGGSSSSSVDKMKQAVQLKKKKAAEKDEKLTTVFVGGLRKSTSEDKVAAHFAKFGQVDNVDIKRLPDGTSRGFAFVKFTEVEAVDKVVEARSSHMIDNKWVAVRPHGGSAFNAAQNAEKDAQAKAHAKEERKLPELDDGQGEDLEEKWSEKYLTVAAQVGALQKEEPTDSVSTTQAMSMLGQAAASPSMAMGSMGAAMPNMGAMGAMGGMMPMAMGMGAMPMGMGAMGGMGMMPMMMNPMMMGMMMNPMMAMGMMGGMRPMGGMDGGASATGMSGLITVSDASGSSGGPAPKEHVGAERSTPY